MADTPADSGPGPTTITIWFSPVVRALAQPEMSGVYALTLSGMGSTSIGLAVFSHVDFALKAIRDAVADSKTGRFAAQTLAELSLLRLTLVEGTLADWNACLAPDDLNGVILRTTTLTITGWRILPTEAHRFDAGAPMLPLLTAIADA